MPRSPQEHGDRRLAHATLGDADHEVVELIHVRVDFDPVHVEECERGRDAGPLVSVSERVIAADDVRYAAAISKRVS